MASDNIATAIGIATISLILINKWLNTDVKRTG